MWTWRRLPYTSNTSASALKPCQEHLGNPVVDTCEKIRKGTVLLAKRPFPHAKKNQHVFGLYSETVFTKEKKKQKPNNKAKHPPTFDMHFNFDSFSLRGKTFPNQKIHAPARNMYAT